MKKAIWEPLALWGWVRGAIGKRFMGFRKRAGGERSTYMPHVGKKEIARGDLKLFPYLRSVPKGVITHV